MAMKFLRLGLNCSMMVWGRAERARQWHRQSGDCEDQGWGLTSQGPQPGFLGPAPAVPLNALGQITFSHLHCGDKNRTCCSGLCGLNKRLGVGRLGTVRGVRWHSGTGLPRCPSLAGRAESARKALLPVPQTGARRPGPLTGVSTQYVNYETAALPGPPWPDLLTARRGQSAGLRVWLPDALKSRCNVSSS